MILERTVSQTHGAPHGLAASARRAIGFLRGALARRAAAEPEPFLIVGNEGVGAEALAARLASLEGVAAPREACWRPRYAPSPARLTLESGEDDLAARLREGACGARLVGCRLALDAEAPFLRRELDELLATLDPSMKVAHVTGDYLGMLEAEEAREAEEAIFDSRLRERPVSALARTLLIFFVNDLVCAEICAHAAPGGALRLSGEALEPREVARVARFLGAPCPDDSAFEAAEHSAAPEVILPHADLLRRLAKELEAARDAVISGALETQDLWRDELPPLHLPRSAVALLDEISALDAPERLGIGRRLKAALGF